MAIKISRTFLLRKLHQITGIVPLGIYFLVHMYTNSTVMSGEKVFEDHVTDIHHLPFLLFVEIFGIFLPLVFHSVYGIMISAEARNNVFNYNYGRNWFYFFQRATGIFLFFFLTFHILNLRFGMIPGLNLTPVAGNADQAFDIVAREFAIPWVMIFYILGVATTAWHLAYGIFLFAVDWGIIIGEKAQKYALYASVGFAVFLSAVGINAAVAFVKPCGLFPKSFCSEAEKKGISNTEGKLRKF
ncbi:MAG: succinate dehydrogenase [Acidobacteria bacterium]|jgi:succinate dehydrogenase / fumarate reductase cytochrome b subunit|nr:succinate dehydrogenase [Acidobacteriota bacterium]